MKVAAVGMVVAAFAAVGVPCAVFVAATSFVPKATPETVLYSSPPWTSCFGLQW